MRRHARAVILLGGWLLMQPPSPDVTRDGKYVDREGKETSIGGEPVTEWLQVAAFDTAERCERARLEGHQQLAAAAKKKPTAAEMHTKTLTGIQLPPPTPAQGRAMRELILILDSASRCVPAEAVYPQQPPAQK